MAPRLSVILPVYNVAPFIESAVDSVLHQSFEDFELIVIDDGSTDASRECLTRISDPRVRLFFRPHRGLVPSLNEGIALSRSDVIFRMDGDDICLPQRMQIQMKYLDAHPQVMLVGGQIVFMDERGQGLPTQVHFPLDAPDILARLLEPTWAFCHPAVAIRKRALEIVGGYDPAFVLTEDQELWGRISVRFPVANVPETILRYRVREGSANNMYGLNMRASLPICRRILSRAIRSGTYRVTIQDRAELARIYPPIIPPPSRRARAQHQIRVSEHLISGGQWTKGLFHVARAVTVHPSFVVRDGTSRIRGRLERYPVGRSFLYGLGRVRHSPRTAPRVTRQWWNEWRRPPSHFHQERTPYLEMHAAHTCNLFCEGCTHFSQHHYGGVVSVAEADEWMKTWSGKLRVDQFAMVGGEPTLNRDLCRIIELAHRYWVGAELRVKTNGFFMHRHPELRSVLARTGTVLEISQHGTSAAYLEKFRENLARTSDWHDVKIVRYDAEPNWKRFYQGTGFDLRPYDDRDPKSSWKACIAKHSLNLYRNRLWKCPQIAYLGLIHRKYPLRAEWDPYRTYEGLDAGCDAEELRRFLRRREETICGMCPAKARSFVPPDPLVKPGSSAGALARGTRPAESSPYAVEGQRD